MESSRGIVILMQMQREDAQSIKIPEIRIPSAPLPSAPQVIQQSDLNSAGNHSDHDSDDDADNEIEKEQEKNSKVSKEEIDKTISLVYPTEILIFAIIGWAWLSLREMFGDTPVMDSGVIISLLVTSILNFLISTTLTFKEEYVQYAKGFAAHVFSLWILYLHSIIESVSDGKIDLCCGSGITQKGVSFSKAQGVMFFGGIPMHQVFAIITWGFLTIVMFISLLQVKSNYLNPSSLKDWFIRKTWSAITFLLVIHTVIFSMSNLTCTKFMEFSGVIICFGILTLCLMVDIGWIIGIALKIPHSSLRSKKMTVLWFSIECIVSLTSLILVFVLLAVIGNRVPAGLLTMIVIFLIWVSLVIIKDVYKIKAMEREGGGKTEISNQQQPPQVAQSTVAKSRLGITEANQYLRASPFNQQVRFKKVR
jgi:hypothetical protein